MTLYAKIPDALGDYADEAGKRFSLSTATSAQNSLQVWEAFATREECLTAWGLKMTPPKQDAL